MLLGTTEDWLFGEMNKSLTTKPTSYTNTGTGITEPQRRVIYSLAKGKGHFLIEYEKTNGRKVFRCLDQQKNIVGQNISKRVVQNLVSKGYLKKINNKIYLK